MEKYYIVENKEFINKMAKYNKDRNERNDFFKDFCSRYGIDGDEYCIYQNGGCNEPAQDFTKDSISLHIANTDNNLSNFKIQLRKRKIFDAFLEFKKLSKTLKAFQDECVAKKIVINLREPNFGYFFENLYSYKYKAFQCEGKYYLSIEVNHSSEIVPRHEGFIEIKGREFHLKLEMIEEE